MTDFNFNISLLMRSFSRPGVPKINKKFQVYVKDENSSTETTFDYNDVDNVIYRRRINVVLQTLLQRRSINVI